MSSLLQPLAIILTAMPSVDIFPKRWKSHDEGVESFAEMQANLTKVAIEAATQVGMKLFQIVQGTRIVLQYQRLR